MRMLSQSGPGGWPSPRFTLRPTRTSCALPPSLLRYNATYRLLKKPRSLEWRDQLGLVDLDLEVLAQRRQLLCRGRSLGRVQTHALQPKPCCAHTARAPFCFAPTVLGILQLPGHPATAGRPAIEPATISFNGISTLHATLILHFSESVSKLFFSRCRCSPKPRRTLAISPKSFICLARRTRRRFQRGCSKAARQLRGAVARQPRALPPRAPEAPPGPLDPPDTPRRK